MGRRKKAISVLLALLMILCLLPTSFASAEDDGVETDPDLILTDPAEETDQPEAEPAECPAQHGFFVRQKIVEPEQRLTIEGHHVIVGALEHGRTLAEALL